MLDIVVGHIFGWGVLTTYYRDILLQLVDYGGCDLGGECIAIDIAITVAVVPLMIMVAMAIMDRSRVRFVVDAVGVVAAAAVLFPFHVIAITSLQIQIIER